jgi:thioredoxin 1
MTHVEIRDKAAISDVAKSSNLAIIDFYADWCGPCKQLATFLYDEIAKVSGDRVVLYKANVDTLDISDVTIGGKKTNIMSLPTVIFAKNGVVLDVVVGANRNVIKQNIDKYK